MPYALLALLAAAAAAVAPAPPNEVSPLVVRAAPRGAPKADVTVPVAPEALGAQSVSIWPAAAREAGVSGYVTLNCRVDIHGLAESCRVIFETPAGQGFGAAALALRPTFKLPPHVGPEGPEDAQLNVAVDFNLPQSRSNLADIQRRQGGPASPAPDDGGAAERGGGPHEINARDLVVYDNPISNMRRVTMMDSRAWATAPGFEALAAAYPALGGGAEGYAVAHCKAAADGTLSRCFAAKEFPAGHGFGKAAVALAPQFRVAAAVMASAPKGAPVEVDVPIRWPAAAEAGDRTIRAPVWVAGADLATLLADFNPPGAKPVSPGAVVKCNVAGDGSLTACEAELTSPDGMDYDRAAVALASRLRMTLWSAEAGPVAGGVVHIAVKREPAS